MQEAFSVPQRVEPTGGDRYGELPSLDLGVKRKPCTACTSSKCIGPLHQMHHAVGQPHRSQREKVQRVVWQGTHVLAMALYSLLQGVAR